MRVWLINVGEEIPSDPGTPRLLRTGILAEYLAKRGHDVTWWNSTVNHQRKQQRTKQSQISDTDNGYRLILLYGRLYTHNISIARILSQTDNAREFARIAPTLPPPDVILCGYPTIELAEAAVRFAISRHIPIATDFRDMWPDVIEDHASRATKLAAFPIFAKWRRSLRFIVKNTTAVTGITDAFVDWALERNNRARTSLDRSFHLAVNPAPPDANELSEARLYWDKMGVRADSETAVGCFAGTLSPRLDLRTIVRSISQLRERKSAMLKLVICGDGPEREPLHKLSENNPGVILAGWRSASEIHVLLERSHFGTLPYLSSPDFVRSYPNKVGEYLGAGLPIMTGLRGEVRKLLSERALGFFYNETDVESATDCLDRIVSDLDHVKKMKPAAQETYRLLFDGTLIYPELCKYLEALASTEFRKNGNNPNSRF